MKWYEIVVCILGAVGGIDFVKFLAKSIVNRKNNARIADSEADASEFHILQEEILFLQGQIKEKEERFADQTSLVRKLNTEILELTHRLAQTEIDHAKKIAEMEIQMMRVKCEDEKCPFRLPPNAFTPPKKGLTKEEYADARENNRNKGSNH